MKRFIFKLVGVIFTLTVVGVATAFSEFYKKWSPLTQRIVLAVILLPFILVVANMLYDGTLNAIRKRKEDTDE